MMKSVWNRCFVILCFSIFDMFIPMLYSGIDLLRYILLSASEYPRRFCEWEKSIPLDLLEFRSISNGKLPVIDKKVEWGVKKKWVGLDFPGGQ